MAKAVCDGALSAGANVSIKQVADAKCEDLLDCDAVIFGTPTNFGYMAGVMKEFFDQAWLTIGDTIANKPYAAFTNVASGDKRVLDKIDIICNTFNKMKKFNFTKAFDGITATSNPSDDVIAECRELGEKMAQFKLG